MMLPCLFFFFTKRQIIQRAQDEALALVNARKPPLPCVVKRILWVFVKVRGVVYGFRDSVAGRKLKIIAQPAIKRNRQAVIGRSGWFLQLVDVVKAGILPVWAKHRAAQLLGRGRSYAQFSSTSCRQRRRREKVNVAGAWQLYASHEQVVRG